MPGAVVGVLNGGDTSLAAVGTTEPGGSRATPVDALVRISSNTKPMVAAAALHLAQDGVLNLNDTVERFIPEMTDRRVLRRLDGPLDETVPAQRSITIEDSLTMRMGFGFVFESTCPAVEAAAAAGLGFGPPDPPAAPAPDEWWHASLRCPYWNSRARYGATNSPTRGWESCSPARRGAPSTFCCVSDCSNHSA